MQSTRITRTHDEDARALEGHVDTLRVGRGQRRRPRMGRRGKDARAPLGRLPIRAMRADCTSQMDQQEAIDSATA
eukprot:5057793-Pyramimonas_sp.AAC.1